MNKITRVTALAMIVLGLGFSAVSYAAEGEFAEAKDHAALASLYEKKANENNTLINEHERMVDSNFIRQNPSATAQSEMRKHCSSIIAKAKDLKTELMNTAAWHKKQ